MVVSLWDNSSKKYIGYMCEVKEKLVWPIDNSFAQKSAAPWKRQVLYLCVNCMYYMELLQSDTWLFTHVAKNWGVKALLKGLQLWQLCLILRAFEEPEGEVWGNR